MKEKRQLANSRRFNAEMSAKSSHTFSALRGEQGRQDLNLQPPVLETGALPVELRPWVAPGV